MNAALRHSGRTAGVVDAGNVVEAQLRAIEVGTVGPQNLHELESTWTVERGLLQKRR